MADVGSTLTSWSATASSNLPNDSTTIGANLADNFQTLQAVVRGDLASVGANIASSANPDVGAVVGLYHTVTGNATITGLGSTATAGIWKILEFSGTPPLVHSTALSLPSAATIQAAAGDIGIFFCEATSQWKCVSYSKASGNASITGTETLTNKTLTAPALNGALSGDSIAAQAEMETGTATDSIIAPGRLHFHPAVPKAWGTITPATTVSLSYPATGVSVVKNGTGDYTVTHGRTFSGTTYSTDVTLRGATLACWTVNATTTTTVQVLFFADLAGTTPVDPAAFSYVLHGDL